jgi:hypothetical protein
MSCLEQTVATFRRWQHLPDAGPLYAVLAAVAANRLEGPPVWLGLVGSPSSGKSEILQALAPLSYVHYAATLTEASLLSGTPKKETAHAIRPHRALGGRTPLQAYSARVKARPVAQAPATHFRVRQDKVDRTGTVTLRYDSRLYKIGIGRAHKGRPVKLLIADRRIRVIDLQGELIRELMLDPSRNYQPISAAYDVSDVPTHVSGMS